MKLRKLKTETLHVCHCTERDEAELAILREPAPTGTSEADPSLHLDSGKQTDSPGQTRSPLLSEEVAHGYAAMRECPMTAAEWMQ